VEQVAPDTVLFSLDGLQTLYGDSASLAGAIAARAPDAHVAIAATPDAAVLAARNLKGAVVIPPGEEIRYLGSLPLECLPLDPDMWAVLDRWGLHTFEDLACLPENGLHERLGESGVRLQRMTRGALGRPLKPLLPAAVFQEQIEFEDHALERAEPVLFLLARFLDDLCRQLKAQSLAAGALHLACNDKERILRLPFPTRDAKFILKLLEHSLDRDPPGEAIVKIRLRVMPAEPRLLQHDLFTLPAPEPERLELTLDKIRSLVGANNVKIPVIRDTYRPGWGRAEMRVAIRRFRPPLEARVEVQAGRPRFVQAPGIRGVVADVSGPWRASGDWWRAGRWDHDEYDLVLSDGALYQLHFDRATRHWLVAGVYD
jgi:protein ImuB